MDAEGNVYIADRNNQRIRKLTPGGTIRTVAGNGVGLFGGDGGRAIDEEFRSPQGVAVDARHNLYVTDAWNQRIRLIAPSGTVWTIAGSGQFGFSGDGGPAENARLAGSFGLAVDSQGCVYIADTLNHRIRKLTPLNPNLAQRRKCLRIRSLTVVPSGMAPRRGRVSNLVRHEHRDAVGGNADLR